MTNEIPEANELTKKKMGNNMECHKGLRRGDIITNMVPKEDWCMVDRVTPAITIGTVYFLMVGRSHFQREFSNDTGAHAAGRRA